MIIFSNTSTLNFIWIAWYLFANTISNGMINPHIEKLSNDYIFENNIEKWFGCFIDMDAVYDFENNPDVLKYIRNIVRKHIPDDEIEYCEDSWDEGNTQNILAGIQWLPNSMWELHEQRISFTFSALKIKQVHL